MTEPTSTDERQLTGGPRGGFVGVPGTHRAERRSTTVWRKGADGDPRLAAELDAGLTDALVLHGRTVPNIRGTLDHVIVTANGVWIVDATHFWGLVEQRDMGNWRSSDPRLFVNGRDQTELVRDISWQATAVRAALDPLGLGDVPVHPVLLFVRSSGRWFSQPIEIDGVRAMWTSKLIELAGAPGPLDAAARHTIAERLAEQLPAKD